MIGWLKQEFGVVMILGEEKREKFFKKRKFISSSKGVLRQNMDVLKDYILK